MEKGLDRYLSPIDAWTMSFGVMVGWGAFVMSGTSFLPLAGPLGTIIAMALGTLFVLVIGMNISFLMKRSSRTGGVYSYTKEAFGRDHAFLCAWFLCLSYLTIVFLNASALFIVARTVFGSALQSGAYYLVAGNQVYLGEVITTVLALLAIGVLYIVAKPVFQYVHTVLSLVLVIGAVAVALLCMPHASMEAVTSFGITGVRPAYGIFSIVILAPWAFVGFEVITFDTAHFRFDIKKSWPIIFTSVLVAGFVYASMAVVSISAVPDGFSSWAEYIGSLSSQTGVAAVPTFHAAEAILGKAGLVIVVCSALSAILTGIIGGYRATTRVLATMAEDKILSEKFSKTTYSILFIMVLSILISFLGRNTLNWFVDLTAFGAIVSFGYTSAATFKIARTEDNRKMMVFGMTGVVMSIAFALVQIVPRLTAMEAMGNQAFLMLSVWCLLGFVFYWRTVVHSTLSEYSGMSVSGIALFALLVYSALLWFIKLLIEKTGSADIQSSIAHGGFVVLLIIFVGLVVMLYILNLVRSKHEAVERDKIRAVEGSLAKSQFLFNMSHDIRTPMNAIIGYTNLARGESSLEAVRGYLDKIDGSSQHLLALINDVLEMSRIESGRVELEFAPEDLCGILESMDDLFSEQMKQKGIDFSVHDAQVKNRYVWCDKKNLNRILLNLLGNAYKFTPGGGTISASLWEIGSGENGYGSYELRVQDSGIGMSQEFVEKMFNAFERERSSTDRGIEGTGLGLAITQSIVDLMGGTIEVLTSPGSGTEMIIRLKFRLATEEEVSVEQGTLDSGIEAEVDFTDKRLLLVEDNLINLEIARMILEQMGFAVESAENGQIAFDTVAASEPGYFDAVLMDIQMPVMDGYAATRAIRALDDEGLASIPILAMTANAFQEDVQAAREAGMQGHIAKPVDVNVLKKTLAEVLAAAQREC
ncbi:MAG: amino acid permease [Coriobacteriales bacterium]|nr:amino acid permease [Coriobacteriales bacterium]